MLNTTYNLNKKGTMEAINIELYDTTDGKCPMKDFLRSLDPKMKAKVLRTIDLLEKNGTALRKPLSSSMGDGIFELRVKQSSNISRVFYFFFVGNNAILTNGFVKKTQKTSKRELEIARKYKADYERRYSK